MGWTVGRLQYLTVVAKMDEELMAGLDLMDLFCLERGILIMQNFLCLENVSGLQLVHPVKY